MWFQNWTDCYSQRGAAGKHQRYRGGCQEEKEEDWVDAKAWVEILPKTLYFKNWKTRWCVFQFKFKYQVFGLLCNDIAHLCVWNCVSQLKLLSLDKLCRTIFCCLSVCKGSVTPDQICTFINSQEHRGHQSSGARAPELWCPHIFFRGFLDGVLKFMLAVFQ